MRSQHPRPPIPPHNAGHPQLGLGELETNLLAAVATYEAAVKETAMARRHETDALNRLRDAQKQLDGRIGELRKSARAGEWVDTLRGQGISE